MVNRRIERLSARCAMILVLAIAVSLISVVPCRARVHDPMRPQTAFSAAETILTDRVEFNLEATMVSTQRRVAVIDGSTVSIGDQYQGHRVASIDEGGVVLVRRGQKISLTLQPTITTPADETKRTVHHNSGAD